MGCAHPLRRRDDDSCRAGLGGELDAVAHERLADALPPSGGGNGEGAELALLRGGQLAVARTGRAPRHGAEQDPVAVDGHPQVGLPCPGRRITQHVVVGVIGAHGTVGEVGPGGQFPDGRPLVRMGTTQLDHVRQRSGVLVPVRLSAVSRQPPVQQAPPVQRLRVQYAKRGRARFASHRDFGRAFERALRRAGIPMAFSSGFSPHPRISYANASPTGAATRGRVPGDRPGRRARSRRGARPPERSHARRPGDRAGRRGRHGFAGRPAVRVPLAGGTRRRRCRRTGRSGGRPAGDRVARGAADDQDRAAYFRRPLRRPRPRRRR